MDKRVETINEYYTNLEYQSNKREAQDKLSNLCTTLNFRATDKTSYRLFHTASLMKKNFKTFASVCEHVDVVTTIIEIFNYIGATIEINNVHPIVSEMSYVNTLLMLTICHMYEDYKMGLFLETAIIDASQMKGYNNYKREIRLYLDIILLEDSDLFAVINCLKFKSVRKILRKIYVHRSIVQTFLWYFKKYFEYDLDFEYILIQPFQSKQDLLTLNIPLLALNTINIVSIWSEDITSAKNLAESFKHNILCINTCMEFDGVIFPYIEYTMQSIELRLNLYDMIEYKCTNPINPTTHQGVIFDLFYNGKWQKPIKKQYWMHNNILLANATREDVVKCVTSAKDGFKIWSVMSSKSKMKILFNLSNIFENEGKHSTALVIKSWMDYVHIFEHQMNYSYVSEKVEITTINMQRGTIILKEDKEDILFVQLAINLAFGNSAIVICDPNLCILAQYCNMFKMCGIPPGVINLLSSEKANFECDIIECDKLELEKIHSVVSGIHYMIVARQ